MVNVILAGVGGQGNVLSTHVLAETALQAGYDVKTSEVHGMARRGGSVVSTVRWGEKVYSHLVPEGRAEYLLAFELLEGMRYLAYLKPGGTAIVNDYRLDPLPVQRGDASCLPDTLDVIRARAGRTLVLEALEVTRAARGPQGSGFGPPGSALPLPGIPPIGLGGSHPQDSSLRGGGCQPAGFRHGEGPGVRASP